MAFYYFYYSNEIVLLLFKTAGKKKVMKHQVPISYIPDDPDGLTEA